MRLLSLGLAGTLLVSGCASNSYRISSEELMRLAATPPERRGASVRVDQETHDADGPPATRVDGGTEVIWTPSVRVNSGITYGPRPSPVSSDASGGVRTGGSGGGGKAASGKDAAIALVLIAAVALVAIVAVEGSRFDGQVELHPMHPVHLYGRDGGYTVVPLAWVDYELAHWADHGIVRDTEGPWHELSRAPLWREGPAYSMLGGSGSFQSALGDKEMGPSFLLQLGYFPTDELGIMATLFLGWRENKIQETMFESRSMLELQYFPVKAGVLHAGVFGGAGVAYRYEDGVIGGNESSLALSGGALFQLELHTRIALTGRLGVTHAHGERMTDALVGIAVY